MSDEKLKGVLSTLHKEDIEDCAAYIAAFCTITDIPLDKGLEIHTEMVADMLKSIIKSGVYDKGRELYEDLKKKHDENLIKLQKQMREAADE